MGTEKIDRLIERGVQEVLSGKSMDDYRDKMRSEGESEEMIRYVANKVLHREFEEKQKDGPLKILFDNIYLVLLLLFGLGLAYGGLFLLETHIVIGTLPFVLVIYALKELAERLTSNKK